MKLYNTLGNKVEEFIPHNKELVTMYTCGPTVYHYAHIGNLRTYIFEDILEKTLRYIGYPVKRVMNITDVGHMTSDADEGEDKMLKGAKREHKTVWELAEFYTEAFKKDTEKLNIKWPEVVSKATDHISEYIHMIEVLLKKDIAYSSGGNIYFDVSKAQDYYALSGKNPEDLMVGVRDDVEEDIHKRNPADFGLWFTSSKFNDQAMKWDSPWGVGYPGWHIECSCISIAYLGEYLDIHCGGVDNIFPHHTNEIAQSEAYLGHPWCKYWCHGEHLNDSSGKMSKSKGEFLTVSLLEEKGYDPLSYRYFCLKSHYRNQLVFSYDSLSSAQNEYYKLRKRVLNLKSEKDVFQEEGKTYQEKFRQALENDLNTSSTLTVVYDVLKSELNDYTKRSLIEEFDQVLSLDLLKENKQEIDEEFEKWILEKIEERKLAKQNKDFAKADQIREELSKKHVQIKDTREGTIFELV